MSDKQVVLDMHDSDSRFTIERFECDWVEGAVNIHYKDLGLPTEPTEVKLPALEKEEFYELVASVEFTMGWKRDE